MMESIQDYQFIAPNILRKHPYDVLIFEYILFNQIANKIIIIKLWLIFYLDLLICYK